ncbi:MAG: hypothetical protein JXO72_00810 [Vicinamibacteria bacterium]|nr:hypothetical protein [Vicinamibacteria bacterium]
MTPSVGKRIFFWTAAALLVSSSAVQAGWTAYWLTQVDLNNRRAWGSLYGTRMSDDNVQHIGCTLSLASGVAKVTCTAVDAGSEQLSCSSVDPKFVEVAQRVAHSYVIFQCNEAYELTRLAVRNSSHLIP